MASKPSDVGRKGLKKLVDLYPKPEEARRRRRAGTTPISRPARGCRT